jgi:hypothetical protein
MTTPMPMTFKFGDRVRHPSRPEWGEAVVTAAQGITHEGKPCQRLTLRFDRAGMKTLVTAAVDLEPANGQVVSQNGSEGSPPPSPNTPGSWLAEAGAVAPEVLFARLPEATRDPFATLEDRLRATFLLFRFSDRGGALLDWAAMQTGLPDPLSTFARHELEQYFVRFSDQRAEHLRTLLFEASKKDPGLAERVVQTTPGMPAAAIEALRRPRSKR